MGIFNGGLKKKLNFGYFWIIMRSDTYVYPQYAYSKKPQCPETVKT